ncbi:ABC transporter permease [Bacillus sp. FJAT-28004]|uniref:ABC transporter permease n=1 Tax=Bacillus sp. FJAT-28004 TaxID=1679165 RepID=UPI0006B52230|nr:ABC transporter permease [Bacillus sp. FJAT-28004]
MTIFSLARKNMKNNFINYFLYFGSMIFSILIYFVFVSLKYDQTIQSAMAGSSKVNSAFSGASVVLIIFVAIFIGYSNSFFTRKRKKEVGLYALLGLRNKQIGRMLFYENFIMGFLALAVGIGLGSLLTKWFVQLLMKVMGYDVIANFSISSSAIINTAIVFLIIALFNSIQGYLLIYRFKLIELFRAEAEGEKEPKTSILITLLSIILIGFGYWIALQDIGKSEIWKNLGMGTTALVIMMTVVIGTYFLFSTLTVTLLKLSTKNKKRYWKGIRLIGTSQLLYRIKANARTLTIIAVLSATTLTAVGTVYSLYYNAQNMAEQMNPNSYMFIAENPNQAQKVQDVISANPNHKVNYHLTVPAIQIDADTTNLKSNSRSNQRTYTLISSQDFNNLAAIHKKKDVLSLKGNETVSLDPFYSEGQSPNYTGKTIKLLTGHKGETITFSGFKPYTLMNVGITYSTLVVSDELFASLAKENKPLQLETYGITNAKKAGKLTTDIQNLLPNGKEMPSLSSFYQDYSEGLEMYGLLIYMAGFLGLVFLAATGSIIYFKQITEANADKGRYQILHKIGVKKKEIRRSIAKQVAFIFALPLVAGIAHCSIALTALSSILQRNLTVPVLICMGLYSLIYFAYYMFTVQSYYKIVVTQSK